MVHTGPVSYSNSPGRAAPKKRSGLWWKILLALVVVVAILAVVAEFGLRAYLKNTVTDELRTSVEQDGGTLDGDPSVSFGASPLLFGLVQGKIPSFTADIPSSLDISYEDSDRSRPVVHGQPAVTIDAKNMQMNGDDPVVGDLTMDALLPPEYLQAQVQSSMADDSGDGGALEGLISVTGVTTNEENNTLDFEITGGLATLSMTPVVGDNGVQFEVDDVKLLGMSLPDSLSDSLSDSLADSVSDMDGMQIRDAHVTSDGLQVTLHGTDVNLNEISTDLSSGGSGGSGGGGSGEDAEAA